MIAEGICWALLGLMGHGQLPRLSADQPPHGGGMPGGGGPPPFGGGGGGGHGRPPYDGGDPNRGGAGGPNNPGGGGPPPRTGGSPPPITDRINTVRRRLQELGNPKDDNTKLLQALAQSYLDRSDSVRRDRSRAFLADRLVSSADSLVHAAGLLRFSSIEDTPVPRPEELNQRLDRLYFRLQQVDYFYEQSNDTSAKPLPDLARTLYRQALQATDGDPISSITLARASGDVVNALESLAQSAQPLRRRFPLPGLHGGGPPPPPPFRENEEED